MIKLRKPFTTEITPIISHYAQSFFRHKKGWSRVGCNEADTVDAALIRYEQTLYKFIVNLSWVTGNMHTRWGLHISITHSRPCCN